MEVGGWQPSQSVVCGRCGNGEWSISGFRLGLPRPHLRSIRTMKLRSSSKAAPLRPKNTLHILDLPHEILYSILSYVCGDGHLVDATLEWPKLSDSPVMTIRAVCRTFRVIAAQLPFWFKDEFSLLSLVTNYNLGEWVTMVYFHELLEDPFLVEQLKRKTGWSFGSYEMVHKITATFPSLREKMTYLALKWVDFKHTRTYYPEVLGDAIRRLGLCRHVRTLELIPEYFEINFDNVADNFPHVEEFTLRHAFRPTGTFEGFESLQKLSVATPLDPRVYTDSSLAPYFLPANSASVLTHLEINFDHEENDTAYTGNAGILGNFNAAPLDEFVNLTSFNINPLSQPILDFLMRKTTPLTDFRATLPRSLIFQQPDDTILSARCLRSLEHLTFSLGEPPWFNRLPREAVDPGPYLEAIAQMTSLQTLHLGIGFHENKLHYLTSLVNLRKLTYTAYMEECGEKYADVGEAREIMIECFEDLNDELPELAEVNVKMTRWKDDLAEILRPRFGSPAESADSYHV